MKARLENTGRDWRDPDDAPELTGEELDQPGAVWRVDGDVIDPEQGKAAFRLQLRNQMILDALDPDVAAWIRRNAPAHDYPSFVNSALRESMRRQNDATAPDRIAAGH